jgi:hypothetical protein
MKTERYVLTLWVMLALIFVFSIVALLENSEESGLRYNHALLIHQTEAIERYKQRWSLEESKKDIEFFKQHQNLVKHEKRGGNLYFEFENLSSDEFNLLSNKILNSMLVIKKITFKRNGESKGSIIVEIES